MSASILAHPGVERVTSGEDEGSDSKYFVKLNPGWGYFQDKERTAYNWICGGVFVDSVAEFKALKLERAA